MVVILGTIGAVFKRRRVPPLPTARPIEEHAGRCAQSSPRAGQKIPCPYVGQPGAFDYGAPFAGIDGVTCASAGELVMPTGQLVAADPLVFLDDKAFTVTVPPGTYPVILAIQGGGGGDVALALLRIREARPVRWEVAVLPNEQPGHHFYPVDSGTGCYADRAIAREILVRREAELDRQVARVTAMGVSPADADAWHGAMRAVAAERRNLLELLYVAGYKETRTASVCIAPETGGNLIAFSSGAGDGSYAVYVGYDAGGGVAAYVTDLGLLEELEHGRADGGAAR